jgi:predicted DNA-binding protein
MPTTVRLDPQTLSLMHRLAKRTGRTKSDVIRDAIRRLGAVEGQEISGSAYEAMEHRLGCWDSGGARLSERTGRAFTALLLAKRSKRRKSSRR